MIFPKYVLAVCMILIWTFGGVFSLSDIPGSKTANSSLIVNDTIPEVPLAKPGLPPGTAKVESQILKIKHSHLQSLIVFLKINRVLGYGSSTPAIATADTIKVRLSKDPGNLSVGKKLICTLQHREILAYATDTKSNTRWYLLAFEPKK